ncbi:MAG: hypothetical protein H6977_00515 [Gammaproteobacteria bacterium]|nr:hypothetical protein [Gammaproteobacteria bacterium]MCP5198459.1 hypothetical protein [Gammaproteobacteria bacterium]
MEFIAIEDLIKRDGLRLVLVAGTPSPWGQAAKAMMEYKGLDFACGAQMPGGDNVALVAWAGINSGPVVAWNDEPPLNRWDDILFLLERLAPNKRLLPEKRADRARALGLAYEMCGPLGLGWNRRLSLFRPAMESGQPPAPVLSMARKYNYNESDVALADRRQVETLQLLHAELEAQRARGCAYFVGDTLTAVDFYWAAFSTIYLLPPPEDVPVAEGFRAMFELLAPEVKAALTPLLMEHRERVLRAHFKLPMEM